MVSDFLIPFREGLEAALIVGIILAYLFKSNGQGYVKYVLAGVAVAIVASIVTAIAFQSVAGGFSGTSEQLFEGVTMLLAAAVLTYVIFWMARLQHTKHIETKVKQHVDAGHAWGLFALSFFAVYREGVELVLFMGAAFFAASDVSLPLAAAGLASAAVVGFLVFKTAMHFHLKKIFNVTGILLILFAAGLVAHGVHEFQEASVLPTPYGKVWNTNGILDEKSTVGTFAKALFGYNGDPFDLEAAAYFVYLLLIGFLYLRPTPAVSKGAAG